MQASYPVEIFFKDLSDRINQVFFAFDLANQTVIYLNSYFENIWQQSRKRFLGNINALLETIHPDDRPYILAQLAELQVEEQKLNIEFRIMQPDNTTRWVSIDAYRITKSSSQFIIGTVNDISERKEYLDNLHKFTDKKNTILEILSHDLAGPLNNIRLFTNLLEGQLQPLQNEALLEMVDSIKRNSSSGINLIKDFVNKEALETSEVVLTKTRCDVIRKIENVLENLQHETFAIKKEFKFTKNAESLYVVIDESKFFQVFQNLLSNAMKFTEDGGVIEITLEDKQDSFLLTVKDNGIGIPKNLQASLFDKFTKARRPGLKGEPSVGLGMSIVKRIIEWHKGNIWVDSEPGKGSTFYVEVPKE